MKKKSYTIKDIAKLAEVSRGTVDRVLHNRGKVSEEARAKVQRVLDEINYEPNLIARSLRNSRDYFIAILVPYYEDDAYWESCFEGLKDASNEYKSFGINVSLYTFSTIHPESYIDTFEKILENKPDGLVMVPSFSKDSLRIYEACEQEEISVVAFNTPPSEEANAAFLGQDLVQSGRLGAELLYLLDQHAEKFLIIHIHDEAFEDALHLKQKEEGFFSFLEEKTKIKVSRLSIQESDVEQQQKQIMSYLHTHQDISGILLTSSNTFRVAQILEEIPRNIKLVGYDLIDKNLDYLNKGVIDFLINQNPRSHAFLSVAHIAESLVFKQEIPKLHLLPLDIVSRENFKYYLPYDQNRTKLIL